MSEILRPETHTTPDLSLAVRQTAAQGASIIKDWLHPYICESIRQTLQGARFSLAKPYNPGKVIETYTTITEKDRSPDLEIMLEGVSRQLGSLVRKCSGNEFPVLANWQPNEVSIQRYEKGQEISSHKDSPKYIGLIALVNVQGEALFSLREERTGPPIVEPWLVKPGDLILLGASLLNYQKSRPFHSVEGVSLESRISLGLRQKLS